MDHYYQQHQQLQHQHRFYQQGDQQQAGGVHNVTTPGIIFSNSTVHNSANNRTLLGICGGGPFDSISSTTNTTSNNNNYQTSSSSSSSSTQAGWTPLSSSSCLPFQLQPHQPQQQPHHQQLHQQQQQQQPHQDHEESDTDHVMARELAELSPQERERLLEDIHGVVSTTTTTTTATTATTTGSTTPMEEDGSTVGVSLSQQQQQQHPSSILIEEKLLQLEDEIQRLRNRTAYNKAHFLSPIRVKDRKFRLMFLRWTNYNVRIAAKRFIQHYEYKLELFGPEKVAKRITYNDLEPADQIALLSGHAQFLPQRDSAGRKVTFLTRKYQSSTMTWKSTYRATWYRMMLALEEDINELTTTTTTIDDGVTMQQRGIVAICYDIGNRNSKKTYDTEQVMKFHILRDALPVKLTCYHYCSDDPTIGSVMSMLRTIGGTEFRLRFRYHYGSHQECQYALMTFGLPRNAFPINEHGELRNETFLEYIKAQQQKEEDAREQERIRNTIEAATDNDVLLGKGWPCQHHPGNLMLAQLVQQRQYDHNHADKFGKVCISWEILKVIQDEKKGRFLEKDIQSGGWRQVSAEAAREKVAMGLRACKFKKQKPTTTASSTTDGWQQQSGDHVGVMGRPPKTSKNTH